MSDDLIPAQIIKIIAVLGGLICIYASNINVLGGFLSIIAIVLSSVYGANSLRKIGEYSLGTGIPSIVYMIAAVSLLSYLLALSISLSMNLSALYPVLSLIISIILAYIISLICKHVFNIQIETLSTSFISLAIALALTIISMSVFVTQSNDASLIYTHTIKNALVILLMISAVMIIQNPYNSCMGPNEDQYRTLALAVSNTFLVMMVLSVITILNSQLWIIYLVISVICWIIFFWKYLSYSKHQVASIRNGGLWTEGDEGD